MEYYRWRNDNSQIVFEYENKIAKRIEITYNNEKLVLNILDVLGASNAVVYNVETATRMPTKLCLHMGVYVCAHTHTHTYSPRERDH